MRPIAPLSSSGWDSIWLRIAAPAGRGSATVERRWKVWPMPGPSNVMTARPCWSNASPHQWSSSLTALVPFIRTTTGARRRPFLPAPPEYSRGTRR